MQAFNESLDFCNRSRPHEFYPKVPSKTRQCYVKMFGHLRDVCATYELALNIGYLHLDFEIAVHEAARQL